MTREISSSTFGARLARLRPVAHFRKDPHFAIVPRPIDDTWRMARIANATTGFNPSRHACYVASTGILAEWLDDPDAFEGTPGRQKALAYQVMLVAHDYYHCWAYRLFRDLLPSFRVVTPSTPETLQEQAFFLILSETVATLALDYWYLSRAGLRRRIGLRDDLGPLTVSYHERHLKRCRQADPELVVQNPAFFQRLAGLYLDGIFERIGPEDLTDNPELSAWLRGELRISTHQRNLALNWLAWLGGLKIDAAFRAHRFGDLSIRHADLIAEVGRRTWAKVRHGRHDFLPIPEDQGTWTASHDAPVDCVFANLQQAGTRGVALDGQGTKSWDAFVDQSLSTRHLPAEDRQRARIAAAVKDIRQTRDQARLGQMVRSLPPVSGNDTAPFELLFSY